MRQQILFDSGKRKCSRGFGAECVESLKPLKLESFRFERDDAEQSGRSRAGT
jgi:hypothetical protein